MNRKLVAVFSASGVTKKLAERIAALCDGDFLEIIPFATSGASGMGKTNEELAPSCRGAKLLKGRRFEANVGDEELRAWLAEA